METPTQTLKPHQGQTITAVFCISLALIYFIAAKSTGLMNGYIAMAAAVSAIPSILFLTRVRKPALLRISRLFSFPVAIGLLLIINTWVKALNS